MLRHEDINVTGVIHFGLPLITFSGFSVLSVFRAQAVKIPSEGFTFYWWPTHSLGLEQKSSKPNEQLGWLCLGLVSCN